MHILFKFGPLNKCMFFPPGVILYIYIILYHTLWAIKAWCIKCDTQLKHMQTYLFIYSFCLKVQQAVPLQKNIKKNVLLLCDVRLYRVNLDTNYLFSVVIVATEFMHITCVCFVLQSWFWWRLEPSSGKSRSFKITCISSISQNRQ